MKTRKLSIRVKILLIVGVLMCILAAILINRANISIRRGMLQLGIEQAATAARISVNEIDGDAIEAVKPGTITEEEYNALADQFRELKDKYGVAYMYTFYAKY